MKFTKSNTVGGEIMHFWVKQFLLDFFDFAAKIEERLSE